MYDIIIIGGGIVGLATALHLLEQQPGVNVLILEKERSGYSPQSDREQFRCDTFRHLLQPGSLRAVNCSRGYKMLLDFCDAENIPYDICGKIIVTREDELERLQNIYRRGLENGLTGLGIVG
ncbi:MAG: FAD-dependent oxidoreductase [Chitinophagales bacterium]